MTYQPTSRKAKRRQAKLKRTYTRYIFPADRPKTRAWMNEKIQEIRKEAGSPKPWEL